MFSSPSTRQQAPSSSSRYIPMASFYRQKSPDEGDHGRARSRSRSRSRERDQPAEEAEHVKVRALLKEQLVKMAEYCSELELLLLKKGVTQITKSSSAAVAP